jgi:phospholipid/cholesterol/gamma-HCH transport system substrate-binding protein
MLALVLVVVLGVYFIVFDVLRFNPASQNFNVTVVMPLAGGLYPGANVTYRGVQVGTVTALDLQPKEVLVKLSIYQGERIPDNGTVHVKELSALGEQYVDFQPSSASGPDLRNGTVVPASRVVLPVPIGTMLIDLGSLVRSITPSDLQSFEAFLTTAFSGTGSDLRSIIVSGQQLFDALTAAKAETINLVVDGHPDLATLKATNGDLATFSASLAALTGQLKSSNSDLQGLINNAQAAELQLNPFLSSNTSNIQQLIAAFATDSAVSAKYQPYVRAIFELLPVVSDDLAAAAPGGAVKGELDINTANTVCPYILGAAMPLPTAKSGLAPLDNNCSASAPDMLQHGSGSTPSFP